tara:strand:- start:3710 stop:4483 length:774 start_codon:yes stop_codon:yes gene_type:complete
MKLEGIIFDVDGTIADTEDIHRQAFNKAFSKFNLNWYWSKEKYHELLFISGGKERITKCLTEDGAVNEDKNFVEELHKCKSEYYRSILIDSDIGLRPGIKRLITEAKENNIKIGIATNSSTENLKTLIKKTFGIEPKELFNTIITNNIVIDKKPSPEVYYRALTDLKLSADNCIAIEDTANGNASAIKAGLRTIITTHAYTLDNDFSGASLVLNNLGEPKNGFCTDENFHCKKSYVDIELINTIIINENDFLLKQKY